MKTHKFLPFALMIALSPILGCSAIQEALDQASETEGETDGKPNQGPTEIESPPEWHCADRVHYGQTKQTVSEETNDPRELEKCPYMLASHSNDPWPGKPHWLGIPDIIGPWLNQYDLVNQNGSLDEGQLEWIADNRLHPMYVINHQDHYGFSQNAKHEDDFRSGLIFNFGLWPLGGVPMGGHRPPIVTGTFGDIFGEYPTLVTHPFYRGRYNAGGLPCNTEDAQSWTLASVYTSPTSENQECAAFLEWDGVQEVHPEYPAYPGGDGILLAYAIDETLCLDNGGEYDPYLAAETVNERGGTLWLNWDEFDQVRNYIINELMNNDFFDAFFIFLDYFESLGFEGGYWPINPDYPYARWSTTGVCSHPAQIRAKNHELRTFVGCPQSMIAVFPDFYLPDEEDEIAWSGFTVDGFCTFPYSFHPAPGVSISETLPEISTGIVGHGSDGYKFIHLYEFEEGELNLWQESLDIMQTPEGYVIAPVNELGGTIMEEFDVPPLSTLIGVDRLSLKNIDVDSPPLDLLGLSLYLDQAMYQGKMVRLMFETEDGKRLHRYLVPVYSETRSEDLE